ncbi:ABC transporter permease [Nonomuraea sp. 3-1Str]|uniref:FtsX-like permease family protein n=1 Tax=Nonomuraea sp. 3-1Str TaxID=2929801 RepID=UPI0028610EB5|nr:FtsX-like permease family protein [Nonomuraea sp. 3-1Str]MDR8409619.1 ABC transporter permease [Nonomuraea sp. 3-1Str]
MTGFAVRSLRHRKAGVAGAFVALLCAAALVCACLMLLDTGLRGTVAPQRYAGAPLVVAGDRFVRQTVTSGDKVKTKAKPLAERAWIPAGLADELRAAPGVSRVVPEVTFPFGAALGHGWESAALTPFTIASGREPRRAGEVVVDARAGLAVGARLGRHQIVGVTAQALPGQDTVFLSTAEARRLAGRAGLVSAIGVFPRVDVSAVLAAHAGDRRNAAPVAYTGDERGAVEFLDAEKARTRLVSLGGALGGTSLLVAILVVAGTFALSVQQRQQEIALLRAVAATPRQVRRLLGGEAVLLGLAAGTLGSAAGMGLGFWLRSRFVALGAMPENLELVVSPFPALAALVATVAAAWVAALVSARRGTRIRPGEALGEAALESGRPATGRIVAGAVLAAGGAALALVLSGLETEAAASPVTMLTALVWAAAVALLGPVLARAAVAALGTPLGALGAAGHLAARNLRSRAGRTASVMAPLTLMVAMTCTILFVPVTLGQAAGEQADAGIRAGFVLSGRERPAATGPELREGTPAARVRRVAGVEAVTEVVRTSVRAGLDRYGAQGLTPDARTVDLGVVAGSLDGFGPGSVALSRTAASRLGVGVGDRLELTLGDGTPVAPRVAALYSRGLGFGDVTLDHALVAAHVDDPSGTLLVSAPALTRDRLAAALPGLRVLDRAEAAEVSAPDAGVNYVAMGLVIAFTAIAVVNTLAMSTSDRAGELALLRLVGTTRRQVLRVLRLETLAAVLVSVGAGTLIALVTLTAFAAGMTGSAAPSVPVPGYLAVAGAAAALALAATALPARLVLGRRPAVH